MLFRSHYDDTSQYCLVSPKIKNLNKNIRIDCIYNLSLNCFTISTANSVYAYIGDGDYILQHPRDKLWTASEVAGLSYTENIDTINCYSSVLQRQEVFDSKMLYIWMNLNEQTDICYSQWLNEKIDQIRPVCLNLDKDALILYQDENCKIPDTTIRFKSYYENRAEAGLLFKYGDKCFLRISDAIDVIYGWIKECEKQTSPCK